MAPGHEIVRHEIVRRQPARPKPTRPKLVGGKPVTPVAPGKKRSTGTVTPAVSTDNASYSVATTFDTVPMANQTGRISVTLTNTGTTTWTGYGLGTQVFPAGDTTGTGTPISSSNIVMIPGSVAPGGTATAESVTPAENPGSYEICWNMTNAAGTYFSAEGGAEDCAPYTIQSYPPVINEQEPLPGTDVDSQSPQLSVSAVIPGGYPANPTFSYAFKILSGPSPTSTVVASSGWVAGNANTWSPTTPLTWGTTYYWEATVTDAATPPSLTGSGITWTTPISFVIGNSQPAVNSKLGGDDQASDGNPVMTSDLGGADYAGSGKTVDPLSGNVSQAVTDASIATVGPDLSIIRTYNSLDPRTGQAFGAGWSSVADMSLVPDTDGSGALILTLADGRQVRFAKNASGGYAPPQTMYAVVTALTGGGFSVTDQTGTTYNFAQASGTSWLLSKMTDSNGMTETFTYAAGQLTTITNNTSGRALHLTWSTPTGATVAHVATVATDPVTAGQPSTALTWNYGYTNDLLTSVCPPGTTTGCTTYKYTTTASHAPTAVLNADPTSYFRLNDPTGTTAAANQIPVNDLAKLDPPATEMNTTLGVAGPVAGVTATGFNGTNSWIPLDGTWCPTAGQESSCTTSTASGRVLPTGTAAQSLAVSLWFKTTASSGVLLGDSSVLPGNAACPFACFDAVAVPLLWIGSNGALNGLSKIGTSDAACCTNEFVSSAFTSTGAVNNGAWHQAVLIPGRALYLDGALVATASNNVTLPAGYALLGAGLTGTSLNMPRWTYFNGAMADVSVYQNQVPSVGIVAAQYAAETHAAAELTTITSPAGRTQLSASYDTANDRVASLTDADGGTWNYSGPVTSASSSAYTGSVMGSSPLDFWPLNDTTGPLATDLVDSSPTSATPRPPATYSGVTLGAVGPAGDADGTAARFSGSGSQITIPGGYFGTSGAQSEELWFSTTTRTGVTLLSASGGGTGGNKPSIFISAVSGCVNATIGTATMSPTSCGSLNNGKWHQVVLTLSSGTASQSPGGAFSQIATLYLDGVQLSTATITHQATVSTTGYTAVIGNGFNGSIADVSLYSSQLNSNEVIGHYASLQNQVAIADATQLPSGATAPSLNTQTITATDPVGKAVKFVYSSKALVKMVSATGGVTLYGYDGANRAAAITDPDGDTSYMTFDAHNNVTSATTCAAINNCQTSYASYSENLSNPLDPRNDKVTDSRSELSSSPSDPTYDTQTAYNANGQVTSSTTPATVACPVGCTTTHAWTKGTETAAGGGTEPAGLLASVTTPSGGVTTYAYDSSGDLMSTTNPLGLVTRYTYDNIGRQLTSTQVSNTYPAGLTTSITYDAQDRPTTQTDPPVTDRVTGAVHTMVTTYTYDADSDALSKTVSDSTGGDPSRTTTSTYNTHGQLATTTDPMGNVTSDTYDAMGNLATTTDPSGVVTAFTYDADGKPLTTTVDGYTGNPSAPIPAENLVTISRAYDPAGRLASVTNVAGTTTAFSYFGDDRLASSYIVGSGGTKTNVTTYGYDAAGNQVTETSPTGLVLNASYNPANQVVTTIEDPSGVDRVVTAKYDAAGDVISDSISQGGGSAQTSTATYNATGQILTQTVNMGGSAGGNLVASVARDQRGFVTSQTDPNGKTTLIQNDEDGRPVVETDPAVPTDSGNGTVVMANPVAETGYDTFGDQTEVSDPDGNVSAAAYDGDGQPISDTSPSYTPPGATAPINGTTTATYNSLGKVTSQTDPLGNVTRFSYDQLGDLASQTDPDGGVWTYTYDPAGQQTGVTSPDGAKTEATYDNLGNLATTTDLVRQNASAAYTTSYAYNAAGQVTSLTSPTGVTVSATYDPLGEQTSTADGAGNVTSYTYDATGQLTKATAPNGTATVATYDNAGRTTSISNLNAAGTVLTSSAATYDADGNLTSETSPRGFTGTFSYDATGMLTSQTQPVSASSGITVTFGYDAAGNPTAYTDGNGNTTHNTYNSLGLLATATEPHTAQYTTAANSVTTDSYDGDGNLVSQSMPGGLSITNSYDSMGNMTSESGSGGSAPTATRTFTYNHEGLLLTAATSAAGTPSAVGYQPATSESFGYDDRGRLLSASGSAGTSTFAYNGSGQVTSSTNAAGTTTYGYDSAGRLSAMADPVTGTQLTYSYNNLDQVTKIAYGSGDSRAFGYNSLNQLSSDTLSSPSGSTVASIGYGYDADGNLTSKVTTGLAGPAANTYGYDEADRLTSWNNGTTTTNYAYDGDGNLTQAGQYTYAFDARDEETSINCTGCTTTTMSFTANGALSQSTGPFGSYSPISDAYGQEVNTFGQGETYDALGRLITDQGFTGSHTLSYLGASSQIASDGTSTYSYDPAGNLVGVGVQGGTTSQGQIAYTDKHTDVVGAFTPSGTTLSASVAYDPWGTVVATSATAMPGSLGFQSAYSGSGDGLVHMGSRWYYPGGHTFITKDTQSNSAVPDSADANPFGYGADDPLGVTDPTGHGPSSGGGGGNVTKADVDAARSRMVNAQQQAAKAEANAKQAWAQAAEAQRAASQEANYARELNSKAGSLLAQYNSTQAKANAEFAKAAREAEEATHDLELASSYQSTLNHLRQLDAQAARANQGSLTIGFTTSGSTSSTTYSFGCSGQADAGVFQVQTGCGFGASGGGGGGGISITHTYTTASAPYVSPYGEEERDLESQIASLQTQAKALQGESTADEKQGRTLQGQADQLHKEYEATKAAAARAAGQAAAAQRYANQEYDRAVYLSHVATDDEDAAKKAEQNYQKILGAYEAEQRAKPKPKQNGGGNNPTSGPGPGSPPILPPSTGNKPPKKLTQTLARIAILAGQALYQVVTEGIEQAALSVSSCVTQPSAGSCIQAAVTVAGTLLGALGGEAEGALAAADDAVDAGAAGRTLFRADTRGESGIFGGGFTPKGDSMDLARHVFMNPSDSGFVATSKSLRSAQAFAKQIGANYIYQVRASGFDVNEIFGADSPYPWENEIAVPGPIPPEDVVGVYGPGGYTPNPGFKP